jgi:flavin-dependent dehydrogenase
VREAPPDVRHAPPDVVVVGAGPAGSVSALLLARSGQAVLVLDRARFPRTKACGECLNPGAVRVLERLGLADEIRGLTPARLAGWDLVAPSGRVFAATFPGSRRTAWGLDRKRFDAALLAAARAAGARVRTGVRVVAVDPAGAADATGQADAGPTVHLHGGDVLRPRWVVGADGLHSVVARSLSVTGPVGIRKASLSLHLEGVRGLSPTRGRMALGGPLTVGLAPLDPDGARWTLSVVVASRDARLLPRTPRRLISLAATRVAEVRDALPAGPLLGSGPFDRPTSAVGGGRVVLVGDAAGYFDPLTGQGLYRAMRSAELAAAALTDTLRGGRTSRDTLGSYGKSLRRAFRSGRLLQHGIERLRTHPRLLEGCLRWLDRARLLDRTVAVLGDVYARERP